MRELDGNAQDPGRTSSLLNGAHPNGMGELSAQNANASASREVINVGREFGAICKACGTRFSVSIGGGFFFHLLRCNRCGATKAMPFKELGEIHLRYLKGLSMPYSVVSSEHDQGVKDTYPGEPLKEVDYFRAVKRLAGKCACGGSYSFNAPPRCPECGSTEYENDPEGGMMMYD